MSWNVENPATGPTVSEGDVKLCLLCGALNHQRNPECFTCGWRGKFDRDPGTIRLAWQRLCLEFEEVRLEHVTGHRRPVLGEYGRIQRECWWQRWRAACAGWWRGILERRVAHFAALEARARSQSPIPPNELGV